MLYQGIRRLLCRRIDNFVPPFYTESAETPQLTAFSNRSSIALDGKAWAGIIVTLTVLKFSFSSFIDIYGFSSSVSILTALSR